MKKTVLVFMVISLCFAVTGCAGTKVLHCDNCQNEVQVKESSNMEEDWTIYCAQCNEELFGDHPILGAK